MTSYLLELILRKSLISKVSSETSSKLIKDLGNLYNLLGLQILYKSDGVLITQRKFVHDLLKDFYCSDVTPLTILI